MANRIYKVSFAQTAEDILIFVNAKSAAAAKRYVSESRIDAELASQLDIYLAGRDGLLIEESFAKDDDADDDTAESPE